MNDTTKERRGPGRPKIGLVRREIKVTPEQDAWLAGQQGGASAAIRRLIEKDMHHEASESKIQI